MTTGQAQSCLTQTSLAFVSHQSFAQWCPARDRPGSSRHTYAEVFHDKLHSFTRFRERKEEMTSLPHRFRDISIKSVRASIICAKFGPSDRIAILPRRSGLGFSESSINSRFGSSQEVFENLTGRVGSGQEVFKTAWIVSGQMSTTSSIFSPVGSGHADPTRPDPRGLPRSVNNPCLLYTSPSPRDKRQSRMPSSA